MSDFKFGSSSRARLETCDYRLKKVAEKALETSVIDFGISCGHRGQEEQDAAYNATPRKSKLKFPESKHNSIPARAFDFFPVIGGKAAWNDCEAFKNLAHHIMTTADQMGIRLRWGGDWNCNGIEDETFIDMPHIELRD